MDNFTPLKTEKKKKTNKFMIIGNIFLVMILVFITSFFLKDKLFSTQEKAAVPLPTQIPFPTQIPIATRTPTPTLSKTPTPTMILSLTPTMSLTPTGRVDLSPTNVVSATASPTEIIVAKISISPTAVVSLPKTGIIKSFVYMVPALIILAGLIL